MTTEVQLKVFKGISFLAISAFVVTGYFYFQNRPLYFEDEKGEKFRITQPMLDELFEYNQVAYISDPVLIQKWEKENSNIDSVTTGRRISLSDARIKKDSFYKWNKKKFNFVKEITPYGFAFGKRPLRKMLHAIDSTNRKLIASGRPSSKDSLIYGVRVYLTFTKDGAREKDRHLDILFAPIMKNGNTYFDMSNSAAKAAGALTADTGGGLLLNTSSPCPNMCPDGN